MNITLLERMTQALLDQNLSSVRLTVHLQLFTDAAWTERYDLEFAATGALFVNGKAVNPQSAESWCSHVLELRRKDPKALQATLERIPTATPLLTKAQACTLHRLLGYLGIRDHYRFSSKIVGRDLSSLTELTHSESGMVEAAAEMRWAA